MSIEKEKMCKEDYQAAMLEDEWTFTTLTPSPKKRIDFVFYTPEITSHVTEWEGFGSLGALDVLDCWVGEDVVLVEGKEDEKFPASDHRPLVAVFALE